MQEADTWVCPNCQRAFFKKNQSHYCSPETIDDVLAGKPDNVLLVFDELLVAVADWEPQIIGAGKKAIIFNNGKAWMVVRPMKDQLDVAFFYDKKLSHPSIFRARLDNMGKNKYIHHFRLKQPGDLTPEMIDMLRKGFNYVLGSIKKRK
ncbi:hypothetical protein CEQ90_11160 [Lewinellaceae bacterium SD302]|nr:hypothetical protein CEQ90_11160 [Lewinellaceae bacterium SD302]